MPIILETPIEIITYVTVTVIVIPAKIVIKSVTPTAKSKPNIPPTTHNNADSIKNCSKICLRVAPSAFRKPTSKVLSVTETSIIFITTMPPTIKVISVIGTTTAAGSWSEADAVAGSRQGGVITLTGASTGISSSGTADGFYFVAAPVTGDFDFSVRVASFTNPGASTSHRMGLMCRASTATNAPYAMVLYKGDLTNGFHARLTAGADPYDSTGTTARPLPDYIRITRVGDAFSAYYSADGIAWTQRGATQTIAAMGASPLVGFALTSAVTATASTAVIDKANFYLPTNIGPNVNAGAALTGTGPWNIDATVTDDARPVPASLSSLWLPEGGVTFASATAVDTGVTFSASGNYRLRLTASDGAITTFGDTTANITVGGPMLSWRQTHFGNTSGNGNGANTADPDGDGIANLVEYALGKSPMQPGAAPFGVENTAGQIVLTFNRIAANNDVTIIVEAATVLGGTWTPVASSVNGAAFTTLAGDTTVSETGTSPVGVTVNVNVAGAARYFRIKAETTTP